VEAIRYTNEDRSKEDLPDPRLNKLNDEAQKKPEYNQVIAETVKMSESRVSRMNSESSDSTWKKREKSLLMLTLIQE
jgi:hypothetical protein